jgi:hypothetical protein
VSTDRNRQKTRYVCRMYGVISASLALDPWLDPPHTSTVAGGCGEAGSTARGVRTHGMLTWADVPVDIPRTDPYQLLRES